MAINSFFKPRNIAIIGASTKPEKLGHQIVKNLLEAKFPGKIYPVNPKGGKILNLEVCVSTSSLPSDLDLAVIAIPAPLVLESIRQGAEKGIKNYIIISAGFAEAGEKGRKLEEELKSLAKQKGLSILGPNCLGLISKAGNLNASFSKTGLNSITQKNYNIAFLSQSGAIGSLLLDWLETKNIGLSHFVSLGNKAGLKESDFFSYLADDSQTDLVVLYLEELSAPQEFLSQAISLSRKKPVAILKAGKTKAGQLAASSHTGSLARPSVLDQAIFKRAGIIELDNLNELFNLLRLIKRPIKTKNNDLYVFSNAGGPAVIASDSASALNLSLRPFSAPLNQALKKILPEIGSIRNPLDLIGDALAERYERALSLALSKTEVENVLVFLTPQAMTESEKTAELIVSLAKKYPQKLIATAFMGGQAVASAKKILAEAMIPNFDTPEEAISALAKFFNYRLSLPGLKPYNLMAEKIKGQGELMDYLKSFSLLEKLGFKVLAPNVIKKEIDLKKSKYPLVLKAVGPNFLHKTEKQAVFLNLNNFKEAQGAYKKLSKVLKHKNDYIVSQAMGQNGLELILGFKRDKDYGPLLMFGWGGIYAEALKDIVFLPAEAGEKQIIEALKRLKVYEIIKGARGKKYNFSALVKNIELLVKLGFQNKDILEIDLNPVVLDEKDLQVWDVRILS